MGLFVFVAKISLTILNTVFSLIGLVMFLLGVLVYFSTTFVVELVQPVIEQLQTSGLPGASLEQENSFNFKHNTVGPIGWGMCICGCAIFVIGFVGCCATNMQSRNFLIIYSFIMSAIIFTEVISIIVLAVARSTIRGQSVEKFKHFIQTEYRGDNSTDMFSVVINSMQRQLKCCGIDSYKDYETAEKWNKNDLSYYLSDLGKTADGPLKVPFSCCKMTKPFPSITPKDLNCAKAPSSLNSYSNVSCTDKVIEYILKYDEWAILGSVFVLVVELAILVLSLLLLVRAHKIMNKVKLAL